MICPYNIAKKSTVMQWVQTPQEDEGNSVSCEQIETETYTMLKCPKEGCAVWRDGRCQFSGEVIQEL